jgi:hypothetical protein
MFVHDALGGGWQGPGKAKWSSQLPASLAGIGHPIFLNLGCAPAVRHAYEALLEVRTHQANEILCQFDRGQRALLIAQHVQTDVVFENFSHEAVDPATHVRQEHQYVSAVVICGQGTFDGVDLPADPLNAGNELLFLFFDVRHGILAYILTPAGQTAEDCQVREEYSGTSI